MKQSTAFRIRTPEPLSGCFPAIGGASGTGRPTACRWPRLFNRFEADQGKVQTVNRVTIEAMDGTGRAVAVELAIRRQTVESWAGDRCRAVFRREQLQDWLATPSGFFSVGDMTWGCTDDGVAVTIDPIVPWWDVSPRDLERLRQWV
jgi:hypothetical protein